MMSGGDGKLLGTIFGCFFCRFNAVTLKKYKSSLNSASWGWNWINQMLYNRFESSISGTALALSFNQT